MLLFFANFVQLHQASPAIGRQQTAVAALADRLIVNLISAVIRKLFTVGRLHILSSF
jgi:hypothetical protein